MSFLHLRKVDLFQAFARRFGRPIRQNESFLRKRLDSELKFFSAQLFWWNLRAISIVRIPSIVFEVLFDGGENIFDKIWISGLIMRLFDEKHFLLPIKLFKYLVHMGEGDERVIFGCDKNTWAIDTFGNSSQVHVIDVESGFLLYDGLQVFHRNFQDYFWQIGSFLSDFYKQVLQRVKRAVQYGCLY